MLFFQNMLVFREIDFLISEMQVFLFMSLSVTFFSSNEL